jgi:hypothetical protein
MDLDWRGSDGDSSSGEELRVYRGRHEAAKKEEFFQMVTGTPPT